FVRIKKHLKVDEILNYISRANSSYEDEKIRVFLKKQYELYNEFKWSIYLRAPPIYFKLIKNSKLTPLKNVAEINYPLKKGHLDFFILSKEKIREWGIEKEYLHPIVTSPKNIKSAELLENDVEDFILLVNEPKSKLKGKNILSYIEYGETVEIKIKKGEKKGKIVKGYHNLLKNNLWYSLNLGKPSPILFPVFEGKISAILNVAKSYSTANFYGINPKNKDNILPLVGILNSSIVSFFKELSGRTSLGEGALDIRKYELENLPIPDPEKLSEKEKKALEKEFTILCNAQRKNDKKIEQEARKELDNIIFDILGLNEKEREQVIESLNQLREMRKRRKEPEILIEHPEKIKVEKQKRIKEYKKPEKVSLKKWVGGI
ncbi:MAG: TaqI-like C-terminal specificity domain-containing protein, partial [Candidatus Aenigmarchaeota archaeon]|nr:hypothetical protein [Candidatus Aenigmarchaeota archaeon]MDW8149557.1 TaqI-like C-terminal specificity domain-containing protein [Candidatus Aenigmarchaeota archaeon]